MSQSKLKDKVHGNSDDMARSILDETVAHAVNTSTNQQNRNSSHHSKPPLPHNNNNNHDEKNGVNEKTLKKEMKNNKHGHGHGHGPQELQRRKSSSNRNIVFHPDHPELINELSSTSTASASPNRSPDTLNTLNTVTKSKLSDPHQIPTKENSNSKMKHINNQSNNNDDKKADIKDSSSSNINNQNKKKEKPMVNGSDNNNNNNKINGGSSSSASSSLSSSSPASAMAAKLKKEQERKERRKKLNDPHSFPKRFEVQVQARVRVGKELTSQHLTDLPEGSVVTVEEICDRRARISRPLCGWLSVTSKFGARIILPTNSKFSKIGGKVIFKRPIAGQTQNPTTGQYPSNAKIIDFDEDRNKYKVRYDQGESQWIDIEDKNIVFVPQHKGSKSKPIDATAPTFTLQTSQAFFNQFFCKDYPQYQAQSSSTTRHMDISPVGSHLRGPHGMMYPHQGHPQSGHPHGMPPHHGHPNQGAYPPPNGQHGQHSNARYPAPHGDPPYMQRGQPPPHGNQGAYPPPTNGHSRGGGAPQQGPHGQLPPHQRHGQYPSSRGQAGYPPQANGQQAPYPPPGPHGAYPPQPHQSRYPPHDPRARQQAAQQQGAPPTKDGSKSSTSGSKVKSSSKEATSSAKDDESFVNKVKEIERRIIQHLHQRGYTETHPDYHRYLQKAKELAIQKAGKERDRQRAALNQQTTKPTVSREEYLRYIQYKKEKERQHALEQQRKAKERAAAANNNRLTSPSKQTSNSVKGLIVLRGLPGSGKTTLAKKLAQRSKNARICTEDRYHWSGKEDGVGEYKFQPQLVFLAREWCTKEIRECIQQNVNLIILDNHNARISMYEDHIQFAVEHGYRFRIIEFVASASLIDRYRSRSYKKFPREVYVKLLKLWEHDPRTELINPTFGDSKNQTTTKPTSQQPPPTTTQQQPTKTPQQPPQSDKNVDKNDKNDKNNKLNDEQQKDDKEQTQYPSQDYSRHPLEQGLNINLLNNNNNNNDK